VNLVQCGDEKLVCVLLGIARHLGRNLPGCGKEGRGSKWGIGWRIYLAWRELSSLTMHDMTNLREQVVHLATSAIRMLAQPAVMPIAEKIVP
jgi:hypothetical protein